MTAGLIETQSIICDVEYLMPPSSPNSEQMDYWNASAGQTWAQFHEQLDRQLSPLGSEALRALAPRTGERIVDIGCGCGQSSLDLARRVGPRGSVVGIDISSPMLAIARERELPPPTVRPAFRQLDAQSEDLGQSVFDAAFSRFGVMFFSEPVIAFANIRAALKPGGRLGFVCWRALNENPWMTIPLDAALPYLPPLSPPDPAEPGPFALADAGRIRSVLDCAGFESIFIRPFNARIGESDLEQALQLSLRVGPLGAALRGHPECADRAAGAVRQALSHFVTPNGVLMTAAVWIVLAGNATNR
jgi:SAM-dependent methyltransferase